MGDPETFDMEVSEEAKMRVNSKVASKGCLALFIKV